MSLKQFNEFRNFFKLGTHEKQEMKKKKIEKGGPHVHPPAAASKPSADQIRQSVRHSLKDILMRR